MRIDKYKSKSVAELQKDMQDKSIKLHTYQLDLKSGKEKDTSKVKTMKKDIARIATLINVKLVTGEVVAAVAEKTETEKADKKETK